MCKLKKALYGFKQAPRTWYDKMDRFLMSLEFTKSKVDSNLYFKVEDGRPMILLLYVNDLFLTGEEELITYANRILTTELEMKYLGMMHYLLGMEVWQSADGIFLGEGKYGVEILKRFGMMDYKEISTPMEQKLNLLFDDSAKTVDATMYHEMIGSLMYLMNMIPDICFAVNTLSQLLTDLIHVHLIATKHMMRYLKV